MSDENVSIVMTVNFRINASKIRLFFSKPDIEIPGGSEKRTKNFGEGDKDGLCSPTDLTIVN